MRVFILFLMLVTVPDAVLAQQHDTPLIHAYKLLYAGKILEPDGGALNVFQDLIERQSELDGARDGISRIARLAVARTQEGHLEDGVRIIMALEDVRDPQLKTLLREASAAVASMLSDRGSALLDNGQCVSARRVYTQALKLNPDDKKAKKHLDDLKDAYGMVSIYSDPWSSVFIDGKKTEHLAPVAALKLLCGQYVIGLSPENGKRVEAKVKVSIGKHARLVKDGKKIKITVD